jgi:hypothetical protein
MLKANEPYRYARPLAVEYKLEHLRVQATGEKRKLGVAKGTPRSATYGSGQRRQRVRSLGQVCERAALPLPKTVEQLPAGELRMLENSDTLKFVQEIQQKQLLVRQVKTTKEKQKVLS